jgi:prefoldin subunit 5
MNAEAMQAIEAEVAEIHSRMAQLHAQLADASQRRDALKLAMKQAARSGGTVISVPAAKLNVSGKV